jgi:hypothetical protein
LILAIFPIYNLNAVAVTVHYSGIEVSVLFVAASRRSIGASTRVQSGGVKFPDGSTARCGESYVRCAGFDTMERRQLSAILSSSDFLTQVSLGK